MLKSPHTSLSQVLASKIAMGSLFLSKNIYRSPCMSRISFPDLGKIFKIYLLLIKCSSIRVLASSSLLGFIFRLSCSPPKTTCGISANVLWICEVLHCEIWAEAEGCSLISAVRRWRERMCFSLLLRFEYSHYPAVLSVHRN